MSETTPNTSRVAAFCARVYLPGAQLFFTFVIVFNAVLLGLDTSAYMREHYGTILERADHVCIAIFVIEIAMKFVVKRMRFFASGWNIFDFLVVGVSLIPTGDTLSVLRMFRIFRVARIINKIERLKSVIEAIALSLPSIGWIGALMLLVFYIFAVLCTLLFGADFAALFGTLGASMLTLFQIMTLDVWSSGVTRSVMAQYPYACLVFVPFVLMTSFIILNAFVGIVVNSFSEIANKKARELQKKADAAGQGDIREEFRSLKTQMDRVEQMLAKQYSGGEVAGEKVTAGD